METWRCLVNYIGSMSEIRVRHDPLCGSTSIIPGSWWGASQTFSYESSPSTSFCLSRDFMWNVDLGYWSTFSVTGNKWALSGLPRIIVSKRNSLEEFRPPIDTGIKYLWATRGVRLMKCMAMPEWIFPLKSFNRSAQLQIEKTTH